ncbi:L,D-transpeptidase family protein [Anaerosinus massiliensis]|uniref:L,D-transpeptidase family protein n=1 Tax=Massilibacillus massiliensis TaxID=1806837 RepID=UPI000DA5FF8B|nr:L,D-transpeptidase [Massilibacillus massiliensis]
MRRYSWLTIIMILFVIMILGIAVWRGFPPFKLHTSDFPGILHTMEVKPKQIEVKIYKAERKLVLYGDGEIIGIFKTAFGFAPVGDKEIEGDGKTPEGSFVICYINDKTPYVYFYGLSYPDSKAAERGLKQGLISQKEYQQFVAVSQSGGIPLWNTPLGGEVGIHGGGNWMDWTKGCVAVSDADILTLKDYLDVGTSVEIFP